MEKGHYISSVYPFFIIQLNASKHEDRDSQRNRIVAQFDILLSLIPSTAAGVGGKVIQEAPKYEFFSIIFYSSEFKPIKYVDNFRLEQASRI
jgi:hypothetical protein